MRPALVLAVLLVTAGVARADDAASARYATGIQHQLDGDCAAALIDLREFLAEAPADAPARPAAAQAIATCEARLAPPPPSRIPTRIRPPSSFHPDVGVAAPLPKVRKRYALQMIGFDLAMILTVGPAAEAIDAAPAVWGLAWLIVPAVLHATNGNGRQAGLSVLRRLLLPPAGALIGGAVVAATSDCEGECWDVLGGILVGVLVGAGGAVVADWVTSYVDVDAPPQVVPTVSVTADRTVLGLATRF